MINIQEILKDIEDNSSIKIITPANVRKPCHEQTFDIIKENNGLQFTDAITSFYLKHNGISVSWVHNKNFKGEINIKPISSLVENVFDDFWKAEQKKMKSKDDKVFRQFCNNLFSIDVFDKTTDGTLRTVFQTQNDSLIKQNPKLWLWHLAGERFPLTLDFEQYSKKLQITRGFVGWTYFFIDIDQCRFNDSFFSKYFSKSCFDALSNMENFLNIMPKLFPHDDFSEFEQLQEEIIKFHKSV